MSKILTPRESDQFKLPFILLTNGGGFTEEKKAEEINKVLGMDEKPHRLDKSHII